MRRLTTLAVCALAFSLLVLLPVRAQEQSPIVRAYLFYSNACPTCPDVRGTVLPVLYRKYGQQLRVKAIEVSENEAHAEWMDECRALYGVPAAEKALPILFIGEDYLVGSGIQSGLAGLVEEYLAQGGTPYPDVPVPAGAALPRAWFAFFFSPSCPHCRNVEETVLPVIEAKYGDRVRVEGLDTSVEANLRALIALGQMAGLPQSSRGAVPVVFIGDEKSSYALLLGGGQIGAGLEPILDWFMEIGGVGEPEWWSALFVSGATPTVEPPGTTAPTDTPAPSGTPTVSDTPTVLDTPTRVGTPTVSDTPSPAETATPSPTSTPSASSSEIHLAYFDEAGCSDCDRVGNLLNAVKNRYPNLVVHTFDVIDDISINLCLAEALGVPEDQRHDAPAIFVGDGYLVGDAIRLDDLIGLLDRYAETGAPPAWEACTDDVEVPPPAVWWAVIVPGLIDGINPCAFATIVFFVSYLTLIERKGREIILVGVAFTLAIFLSYLGFGILLRQLLASFIDLVGPILKPILNGLTAVVCIVLAILSYGDYQKARRGRVRDMRLRLPDRLRRWINAAIRSGVGADPENGKRPVRGGKRSKSKKSARPAQSMRLVAASFVTGIVVSFVELTCTGQVYAPIILGLSNPEYQGRALLSLIVYCLAFIVPLIVVFAVSYMGTSSRQLAMFLQRHTATFKLLTAGVFVLISLWLLYDVVRVWGLIGPVFV
ncbi:MAG: hypothetical protein JXA09_16645 [Anaerolineae bacterium]|nr:hypothetical protein [Anaerolineae bacterium]